MMFPSVVLPLVVAMVLAVGVTTVHRRLPPVLAARAVTVTVIVVVGAAVPTLWLVGFGYLAHVSIFGRGFAWCAEFFGIHDRVPAWAGIPALALAIFGTIRVVRVVRMHRRLRHDQPGAVEVVGHPQPFAFTLPGRGGHVVLSSGIVDLLDADEQAVVLAHEGAHARHRHDRYLLVVQLACAAIPLLRPLTARAQFSLERWADEAAVQQCGNRRFVADTLAKVALHTIAPVGVLAFAGLGVTARVEALLSPPPAAPRPLVLLGLWAAIGVTGVLAAFQIHHLGGLMTTLCPD